MGTIKLLLVDDSEIHLEGLKLILSRCEKMEIVGCAQTVKEAENFLAHVKPSPDVMLLDISLEEEMDGLKLAKRLHREKNPIAVIILSHYKEIRFIVESLKARVRGYVAKDTSADELLNGIVSVMGGKSLFFGDTISHDILLKIGRPIEESPLYDLTDTELEVLQLLAQGYSSKEVASMRNIKETTVESYKDRIKVKFGCNNLVEMVVFAINHNIIHVNM